MLLRCLQPFKHAGSESSLCNAAGTHYLPPHMRSAGREAGGLLGRLQYIARPSTAPGMCSVGKYDVCVACRPCWVHSRHVSLAGRLIPGKFFGCTAGMYNSRAHYVQAHMAAAQQPWSGVQIPHFRTSKAAASTEGRMATLAAEIAAKGHHSTPPHSGCGCAAVRLTSSSVKVKAMLSFNQAAEASTLCL